MTIHSLIRFSTVFYLSVINGIDHPVSKASSEAFQALAVTVYGDDDMYMKLQVRNGCS